MKNHMVESHASLFGLKFWTFNLGDNQSTLEPVFGVEGRSITDLTLSSFLVDRLSPFNNTSMPFAR